MHGTLTMILEWVGKTEIASWVECAYRMCMCVCVCVACLYAFEGRVYACGLCVWIWSGVCVGSGSDVIYLSCLPLV